MRKLLRLFFMGGACALLSGCFCIGCFVPQLPPPSEPYRNFWTKIGMTEEGRRADWIACGGSTNGGFSMDPKKMRPGETYEQGRTRQGYALQRCMIQQGYRFTGYIGNCAEPYMKGAPRCGAP